MRGVGLCVEFDTFQNENDKTKKINNVYCISTPIASTIATCS